MSLLGVGLESLAAGHPTHFLKLYGSQLLKKVIAASVCSKAALRAEAIHTASLAAAVRLPFADRSVRRRYADKVDATN
jgi:hypothetical protein